MRPLVLIHPDAPATAGITDQYYLGADLLVAPVVEPGVTGRSLYLPRGQWYDFWTGGMVEGGRSLWFEAPWDRLVDGVRLPLLFAVRRGGKVTTWDIREALRLLEVIIL